MQNTQNHQLLFNSFEYALFIVDVTGPVGLANDLGVLYKLLGYYSKAEQRYQQALEIREKALGPKHPDIANNFNNLGSLFTSQGLYSKAENAYLRVLKIAETTFGPEHPVTAIVVDNLAVLYHSQGLLTKAEPLYLSSLEIRKKL